MPYTPTSAPGIALAQLRRMLSLSETFQAGLELVDESDALTCILIGRHPFSNLPSGGACIYLAEQPVEYDLQAGGEQLWLHPTGSIVLQLVLLQEKDPIWDAASIEDRYLAGVDFVINVAKDVATLSDAEDADTEFDRNHLAITKVAAEYTAPSDIRYDSSRRPMFLAKLHVDWGIV